jgi:hypothetical protein
MAKVPAFGALPELRFEKFMRFDELGITFHKNPIKVPVILVEDFVRMLNSKSSDFFTILVEGAKDAVE